MGLISKVRDWFMRLFMGAAVKEFDVDVISSAKMEFAQITWQNIINGTPYWLDVKAGIETINFAKFLCYYTSKKTCLDLKVTVTGSARADYINQCIDKMITKSMRDKVEDACGMGGIILKPNGTYNPDSAIDYIMPGDFVVTDKNSNGDILGAIFIDKLQKGDVCYTRLEYHHFENTEVAEGEIGRVYTIDNKAYKSSSPDALGNNIALDLVNEWKGLEPIVSISNVEKPLFGYFKMPYNNTIDYTSPEGVALFANCIKELKDMDVAWSRKSDEVYDSKHMTFVDQTTVQFNKQNNIELPRFIQGLDMGVDGDSTVKEHVATMLTDSRIADINATLSLISTKSGFSQGQFILDRKTGMVTATQIESDDSETVETITDIRNALKQAIRDLIYAINKYCDVFYSMPSGYVNALDDKTIDEEVFYFKDLLSTFEQDRQRVYQMVRDGKYPYKRYLMEYESLSEEEAIQYIKEVDEERKKTADSGLFGEE